MTLEKAREIAALVNELDESEKILDKLKDYRYEYSLSMTSPRLGDSIELNHPARYMIIQHYANRIDVLKKQINDIE